MATTTQSRNGTATDEATFPLNTFREAAAHLRRPFTAAAVKFKVQATWPKGSPSGGLIVCYIDARLVVERLNLIIPDRWADAYEPVGKDLLCHLTIDGITRTDIGEGTGKGLYSDALKRAAVKFGVGVSLYATPKMILNVSDGHLKVRGTGERATLELTPNGETHIRNLYAAWLNMRGRHAFGEPLDHGDVDDAQGDAEVDAPPPAAAPEPEPPEPALLADESVAQVAAAIKQAAMGTQWVRSQLVAIGVHDVPEGALTKGTIQRLTPDQALRMVEACEQAAESKAATR